MKKVFIYSAAFVSIVALAFPFAHSFWGRYIASQINFDDNIATLVIRDYVIELKETNMVIVSRVRFNYEFGEENDSIRFVSSTKKYRLSESAFQLYQERSTELLLNCERLFYAITDIPGPYVELYIAGNTYVTDYLFREVAENLVGLPYDPSEVYRDHYLTLEIADILLEQAGITIEY